ncbi:hypothetical protein BC940DRAFT_292368 [Gongronella butleri]|nr:hypothetical protein BC940DRAFT_292368 [Gongronella butleri]
MSKKKKKKEDCSIDAFFFSPLSESKAQLHFRQLAFVAGKLDRIMVLPNVHSSHLGACRQYAFDYYYDLGWLDNNKDAFSYISMERFLAWTAARRAVQGGVPSAQEISIELPGNPSSLPTGNCLADQFDFSGRPRYDLALEDPESKARRKTNYLEVILSALSDKDNMHVPANLDVVHLYFDRRFAFMSDPRVHVPIDYHARWRALANDIAQQLHPYVAVHWRMEMLEPVSNMVPCAQALVEKIQGITNGMDAATNVFLLTDYPHLLQAPGARPESMSFKVADLHQDHHDAIKYLYDHVNVTLTTVLPQAKIPTDSLPPTNWNLLTVRHPSARTDRSVLGIIDKLVAIQADWFLYGHPMVCGKASSFTRRIQYDRAQNPQAYQLIADTFNFHAHK